MKNRLMIIMTLMFTWVYLINPLSVSAASETEVASSNEWQFEITPYFFASGLSGTSGVNGITADMDMSFSDIWENLDAGFMGMFEVQKGQWIFGFEGVYFKIQDEKADSWDGPLGNTNTGNIETTMSEQLYQVSAGCRMIDERVKVDMLGAFRTTILKGEIDLTSTTGSTLLPDGSNSADLEEIWVDPLVGVRVLIPLIWNISAVGYTDIGGFGIGSDFTWQLLAGLNWQFSSVVSAKIGYRCLYQDYEDNDFIWDMTASGYYLGAGFKF